MNSERQIVKAGWLQRKSKYIEFIYMYLVYILFNW